MRRFIRFAAVLIAIGGTVAGTSAAYAAFTDTQVGAVGCINAHDPHHDVKVFWTAGRLCPMGHYGISDAFASGVSGPQGPQGPKGDPGDSVAKVAVGTLTITASSPATQTLIVKGLPAKSSAVVELVVNNAGEAPAGTVVTVTALSVANGSVERGFTVASSGFTGSQSFTLAIKVLSITA